MKVTSSILYLKVTYDEETEEWNICRTSTLFYQIIKLRSVDFKFKLDTEFDEVDMQYKRSYTASYLLVTGFSK